MLVQYNAAAKATPPKAAKKEVNYFQPEDIVRIREALDKEPLKWKVATHLLLITGCRRGEVMGLRWDRVDFVNSKIKIDTNLLYSAKRGIYEDTTKTDTVRFIKLPPETMELLRQYRRWYLELKLKNGDRWHDTGFLFVKLEDSRMAALRAMSHKTALDELEEMMSHNIFDSEAEKARREEWRRQWDEFISDDQNADTYRELKGSAASMFFWQWQERKGYITHEQLVKMAGHENTIARWFREMPGIDPEEWQTPFPEYPEYDGDDAWGGFYGT